MTSIMLQYSVAPPPRWDRRGSTSGRRPPGRESLQDFAVVYFNVESLQTIPDLYFSFEMQIRKSLQALLFGLVQR